jgi:hypothetical protein
MARHPEAPTNQAAATTAVSAAPLPPPCWCGRNATDNPAAVDHDYTPAQGIESEAHNAW